MLRATLHIENNGAIIIMNIILIDWFGGLHNV